MKKQIISILLACMIMLIPIGVYGAEEGVAVPTVQANRQNEQTDEDSSQTDLPQEEGPMVLVIDDQHTYEGMEKPYKSGYTPTVKDGKVTVVLPLIGEGNLGNLTVTPNLGDPASAPFVFQNYQKTVGVSAQKIDGTEKTQQVYYIRFDFALAKSRFNGTYPITIDVQGQGIAQSFTSYVTITDGKDPSTGEEVPVAAEPKPESQPILIVSDSTVSPEIPEAGEEFTVDVKITNTNEKKAVQNMTVTVATDNPLISLEEPSNTFYFEKFGKGHTETLPLHLKAEASTPPGKYNITLTMSYDNTDATTLTSTGTVQIEVAQPMRVELTLPQIPESVNAGDTLPFSFQFMNLGRGNVYNVRCEINVPGFMPAGAAFAGNMEAGTSVNAEVNVFIGTKDMSEDSEETEKYGYTSGTITLIYEDESGKEYSQDFEITANINEPVIAVAVDENAAEEEQKKVGQWWIAVAALGGAIVIAAAIVILRKRRKNHES